MKLIYLSTLFFFCVVIVACNCIHVITNQHLPKHNIYSVIIKCTIVIVFQNDFSFYTILFLGKYISIYLLTFYKYFPHFLGLSLEYVKEKMKPHLRSLWTFGLNCIFFFFSRQEYKSRITLSVKLPNTGFIEFEFFCL